MRKAQILIAEDDLDLQELIGLTLGGINAQLLFASTGKGALSTWRKNKVDLLILDIMMPDTDGLEVLRRIRRIDNVPVILLTARGLEHDVVLGLESGADDYIVKPFRGKELCARVKARLDQVARFKRQEENRLAYENLVLDVHGRRVIQDGQAVEVTPLEFQLLRYLMQNVGIALTKEDLLRNVWGYNEIGGDLNLIEAAVKRLRKKLELNPSHPQYIQTVWGVGYRLGMVD